MASFNSDDNAKLSGESKKSVALIRAKLALGWAMCRMLDSQITAL
jgi:hypothetical protein